MTVDFHGQLLHLFFCFLVIMSQHVELYTEKRFQHNHDPEQFSFSSLTARA